MNRIDESLNEFEYSSGWRKMFKDDANEKLREEFRNKIEELELKLEELNSSLLDLIKNEQLEEKQVMEDVINQKIYEFEAKYSNLENSIKNIELELKKYGDLMENQKDMMLEIMDILKNREDTGEAVQRGFMANIFKKK